MQLQGKDTLVRSVNGCAAGRQVEVEGGDSEPLQLGGEGRDRGSGVRGILFLSKARRLGPHRLGRGTTSKKWGQQGGNSGNWFLAGVGDSAHHTTQLGVISPDSRPSRNPMGRET